MVTITPKLQHGDRASRPHRKIEPIACSDELIRAANYLRKSDMHPPIELKRSGPMPFAPAPRAVRAGDYVFTSSIYPIDDAGHAVMTDERLGEAGPSLTAAQARHCFETLKTILDEHGSSLDRVLKAEVHLADAADFYEFKLVWRQYFPNDPPARTTVEVGDTLPFRGARLNLDVVALAGDSKLERQA